MSIVGNKPVSWFVSFVALPLPSIARTTAVKPSLPIQAPLPSSSISIPQPPHLTRFSLPTLPIDIEPVPTIITIPSEPPKAPSRASSASLVTSKSLSVSFWLRANVLSNCADLLFSSSSQTPARPMTIASSSLDSISACSHKSATMFRSLSQDSPTPTVPTRVVPANVFPATFPSLCKMPRVLVPPPSIPIIVNSFLTAIKYSCFFEIFTFHKYWQILCHNHKTITNYEL